MSNINFREGWDLIIKVNAKAITMFIGVVGISRLGFMPWVDVQDSHWLWSWQGVWWVVGRCFFAKFDCGSMFTGSITEVLET
jgi:hypothetical protein